jgi:hypothetical protein
VKKCNHSACAFQGCFGYGEFVASVMVRTSWSGNVPTPFAMCGPCGVMLGSCFLDDDIGAWGAMGVVL